jgi:serine/threonine-protein kinase
MSASRDDFRRTGDRPGRKLGERYELVEQIGSGGMAVVWRALTHGAENFRQTVAIKRVELELRGYPEVAAMFVEEARVGTVLRHPNIVQIHDFGLDDDGEPFLVTEWVDGLELGQWVTSFARARLETPWPELVAIAIEVLRALDSAHSRRDASGQLAPILHRDVTPPNVLLDVGGWVKLADFGMARAMDRGRMTRPNFIKGKLSYLAPELVLGEAPTAQSDLFSLGIVMWEALAMARLFDGPTDADVVQMVRDAAVPLLGLRRPNLPLGLTTAVHRALEKDPARRYASAREMLRALTAVLRVLPDPVDGPYLAKSVIEGRRRLAAG